MDDLARYAAGTPLGRGKFRVVVSHSGGRLDTQDFETLVGARTYADDVVSEWSEEPQLAYIFDDNFVFIHEGKAYYSQ